MGPALSTLVERDAWASGDGPTEADAERALGAATLREAMGHLKYGPVADYFAYRWSDPTYLSGLQLLEDHAGGCSTVLELACGIGHYLRELRLRDVDAVGLDVVPSKVWLAREFLGADARVHDAGDPLPFDGDAFDLVLVHDAFHYLPDQEAVAAELRRVGRRVVVGHAHNRLVDNLSPGAPRSPAEYAGLLPGARLYDDAELTRGPARERSADELAGSEAIALVWGETTPSAVPFRVPPGGRPLRRNPLLGSDGRPRWPSDRYAAEYGPRSDFLRGRAPHEAVMGPDVEELARRRLLLDLPERW